MATPSRTRIRIACALISATCAVTAAAIRSADHHRHESEPSWYQSDDPCDYKIGDRYGHLTVCDIGSPTPVFTP